MNLRKPLLECVLPASCPYSIQVIMVWYDIGECWQERIYAVFLIFTSLPSPWPHRGSSVADVPVGDVTINLIT